MTSSERLDDLLADWAIEYERGHEVSVGELCRNDPDLVEAAADRIQRLKETEWMFNSPLSDDADNILPSNLQDAASQLLDVTDLPDSDLSLDEFKERIADSGLVAEARLQSVLQQVDSKSDSAAVLAEKLKEAHILTGYQIAVLAGRRDAPLRLGDYDVVEKIGAGGMGQVFLARHRRMKRLVALKILPRDRQNSKDAIKRFEREVEAAANLLHGNIVTAFDAGQDGSYRYLITEYIKGGDLAQIVKAQGPFTIKAAVDIIVQAATGLEYAHGEGIIHRDIKPSNLLLDDQQRVKILDMGLARFQTAIPDDDPESTEEGLTAAGSIMGTVDFMAPEQARDARSADARSDVYSLGCTLFYLIAGRVPYPGKNVFDRVIAHSENPIPRLSEHNRSAPPELDRVFSRMVAKQPADRYASMTETLAAMKTVPIPAEEATNPTATSDIESPADLSTIITATAIEDTLEKTVIGNVDESRPPNVASAGGPPSGSNYSRFLVGGAAIGAVLLAILYFAGVIFKLNTPQGTLIIEVDDPRGLIVEIDDEEATCKISSDGKAIELSVTPGSHRLAVKTPDGILLETEGSEVKIEAGDRQTIKARLVPSDTGVDIEIAEWALSLPEGVVNVNRDGTEFPRITDPKALPQPPFALTELYTGYAPDDRISELHAQLNKLKQLSQLRRLDLKSSRITDKELEIVGQLNQLETLVLGNRFVTDKGVLYLRNLSSVKNLTLSCNNITDESLKTIGQLSTIETLALRDTQVTNAGVMALSNLPNLQVLDLVSTQVNDGIFESLASLKQLKRCNLGSTKLSTNGLEGLKRLTRLESLGISTDIKSTADAQNLVAAKSLTTISLDGELSEAALQLIVQSDLNIKTIGFAHKSVTDNHVKILTELGSLEELTLGNTSVTDAIFDSLKQMPRLKTVNLRNTAVSQSAVAELRATNRYKVHWE